MAYIPNSGEDDPATQNVATNLFQQTTGGGAGGQPVQNGAASPVGQGGDQSQSIQGGPQGSTQKAPTVSNSASSSKDVIRRNEGKAQSPYDLGEISANIKNAKTSLQDEANSYVKNQSQADYSVPADQVTKALSGDKDAYGSLGTRLTQAKPGPAAFSANTNTDYAPKINQLEDSSLKNYFKSTGGPMATAGDAAFDTMLLGKNKEFKQQRDAVKNEAFGLDTEAKAIKDKAAADAKAGYDTAYDKGTRSIKDTIGSQIDPIRAEAERQAKDENDRRKVYQDAAAKGPAALRSAIGEATGKDSYKEWITKIADDLGQNGDEDYYLRQNALANDPFDRSGNGGIRDAATFINIDPRLAQAGNYLSQDQAGQLTRGQNLLGSGGPSYAALGDIGNPYTFNKDAATSYLAQQLAQMRATGEQDRARSKAEIEAEARERDRVEAERQQGIADAAKRENDRNRETNVNNAVDYLGGGVARGSVEEGKKLQKRLGI